VREEGREVKTTETTETPSSVSETRLLCNYAILFVVILGSRYVLTSFEQYTDERYSNSHGPRLEARHRVEASCEQFEKSGLCMF